MALIAVLIIGFAILLGVTFAVRDFKIIAERPLIFIVETLVISVIPAVPLFFFTLSRGISMASATKWVAGLSIKFAIFHIVFQTSGFYTYMFQNSESH